MIQATGILVLDGGLSVTNPLINICWQDVSKFDPKLGIAEIGTYPISTRIIQEAIAAIPEQKDEEGNIIQEAVEAIPEETMEVITFKKLQTIGVYPYEGKNPNFDNLQQAVLEGLIVDFPTVNFEIV